MVKQLNQIMSKQNKTNGPGRPSYDESRGMAFPKHRPFSFREYCSAQGMEFRKSDGKYIKGTGRCTPLTLRKYMDTRGCPVIEAKGIFAEPLSKKGLGRKAFMLTLRDGFTPKNSVEVTRVSRPVEAKPDTATATPAKRKYTRKAKATATATPKAKRKYTRKATATVDVGTSQTPTADTLDKIHAALAAPTPALAPESAPVATVPVVEVPAPAAPAPAPAPVAQESANAETATPVPTAVS
jgi:hypothetical protein